MVREYIYKIKCNTSEFFRILSSFTSRTPRNSLTEIIDFSFLSNYLLNGTFDRFVRAHILTSMALIINVSPSASFPSFSRAVFLSRFLIVAYTLKRFSGSLAKSTAVSRPMPVEQPEIKTTRNEAIAAIVRSFVLP